MTHKPTRAEKAVVGAAMRYYRWLGMPPSRPEHDYDRPIDRLIAACARLSRARNLPKGKK